MQFRTNFRPTREYLVYRHRCFAMCGRKRVAGLEQPPSKTEHHKVPVLNS